MTKCSGIINQHHWSKQVGGKTGLQVATGATHHITGRDFMSTLHVWAVQGECLSCHHFPRTAEPGLPKHREECHMRCKVNFFRLSSILPLGEGRLSVQGKIFPKMLPKYAVRER